MGADRDIPSIVPKIKREISNKEIKTRKDEIQVDLRRELGLLDDQVTRNYGSRHTGNTERRVSAEQASGNHIELRGTDSE